MFAQPADRERIQSDAAGKLYFFRYLRIVDLARDNAAAPSEIRMRTREPGSGMGVDFTVRKDVSLERALTLTTNDAVAVTGRIQSIDGTRKSMVLDPVIVRYKDRLAPTAGKENLFEVVPTARRGTDTSSGREVVLTGPLAGGVTGAVNTAAQGDR
jgi:hypothetical protein